jgi:hypothetical protein
MEHLHYELDATPDEVIEVTLFHAANVLLLDSANYNLYREGRQYQYRGGPR